MKTLALRARQIKECQTGAHDLVDRTGRYPGLLTIAIMVSIGPSFVDKPFTSGIAAELPEYPCKKWHAFHPIYKAQETSRDVIKSAL